MKKLPFVKMHGIGNDFIMILEKDLELNEIVLSTELIQKMCNRNFGIGSDGIVLITNGKKSLFKYMMYNPDGSQAEMCGNGIRCYMKYLLEKGLSTENNINVETGIGILNLGIDGNIVTVDMGKPGRIKNLVYTNKKLGDRFPLRVGKAEFIFTPVSMGNPHAVIFCRDMNICGETLDNLDLNSYGPFIENLTEIFPDRTNVEFAKIISEKEVIMRVWERGASETLACGTGACATVVAGILAGRLAVDEFITVKLAGGILEIKWSGNENDSVIMKGESTTVFEGVYYVK